MMFDKKFTITLKDFIAFVTIIIPCIRLWFTVGELNKKVDVIYDYYVHEGLNTKVSETEGHNNSTLTFLQPAIKDNQEFDGMFKRKL